MFCFVFIFVFTIIISCATDYWYSLYCSLDPTQNWQSTIVTRSRAKYEICYLQNPEAAFLVVEFERYINLSFTYAWDVLLCSQHQVLTNYMPQTKSRLLLFICFCEQSFIFTESWWFHYELYMAIFMLQWQSWVVVIKTVLQGLKYLLPDLFQERFANRCPKPLNT